jgi:signal transduction histidine kinase
VADTLRPEFESRKVELAVRADSLAPIAGDPARLQQVLANIVSNAIRFARSPGGRVEIDLRAREGSVEIEVRDDGRASRPPSCPTSSIVSARRIRPLRAATEASG